MGGGVEREYRARILVEVVLCPDSSRGAKRGENSDERAVFDACNIKGYLEDPEIQDRIDEAGARGRIIGAWLQDVRRVAFEEPLPMDDIFAADLDRRVQEARRS